MRPVLCLLACMACVRAIDEPFDQVPLPRAVTQMEHRLGVSDSTLPGGKKGVNKGQFALSSYDQQILAKGPPSGGGWSSGAGEGQQQQEPQQQVAMPTYAQPQYAQPQYGPPAYPQQEGYPQQQGYASAAQPGHYGTPYQQYAQQYPQGQYQQPQYAQAPQQYTQYSQGPQYAQPQQWGGAQGHTYYDYSQAQGRLGGANGDIASAQAYTDNALPQQAAAPARKYSNLGWHPTLSRMMGVPKADRAKGPQLHLQGQLAKMKAEQVPQNQQPAPSVDPKQSDVAASKLKRAQALLRKSVRLGLRLHGSKETQHTALGEDCEEHPHNLHCHLSKTNPMSAAQEKQREEYQRKSQALARVHARQRRVQASGGGGEKIVVQDTGGGGGGGRKAFEFPADMLRPEAPPVDENKKQNRHALGSSIVLALGIFVIVAMVAAGATVAYVSMRREKRRNLLQAMSGVSE